ncbi:MAG: ABC transporter ATP-binding protein [Acidimicrobiia bacterium]|nr:ABC transporter ATP-binding protein [Acidimicrobiia bacterium]
MTSSVVLRQVSVDYGSVRALQGVDLEVGQGETLALLGPSGSGKTTLIHAVAGFVPLTEGEIIIDGNTVATATRSEPPDRRRVGVVFQNYALWPHLDAVDTVAYPLRRAGMGKAEARAEAARLMDRLGIGPLKKRRPSQLSGGQQQRVGLARALARRAAVYLLDEPTAHLDAEVRAAVQAEIARVRTGARAAAIHATHDAAEALALADRVVLLRAGAVVQVGTPREVYERPADLWAARLTGPASVVTAVWDGSAVAVAGVPVPAPSPTTPAGEVELLVRPDWVLPGGRLEGEVTDVFYRGTHTDHHLRTAAGSLVARLAGPPRAEPGSTGGWTLQRGWVLGGSATPDSTDS